MSSGISKVRVGLLLPGGTEVGEGSNKPLRCVAATHDGEIAVIAKKLSVREISVEVVCAVVGRAAGLPIPEPLLLVDETGAWHYGSADVGHPSLAQFVMPSDSSVLDELVKWPSLLQAACFDELIANPDRNDGNLLYDGAGFFLIDHGMCIPHGMSAGDISDDYHNNQLLGVHEALCKDELSIQRAANNALEWSIHIGPQSVDSAANIAIESADLTSKEELLSFLKGRMAILGDLLYNKIKPSQQGRFWFND